MSNGSGNVKSWVVGAGIAGACVAVVVAVSGTVRTGAHERRSEAVKVALGPPPALAPVVVVGESARDGGLVEAPPTVALDEVDHAARASELIQEGDADGALAELELAVQRAPQDVELHWKIAHLDEGERGVRALREISRLRALDPAPVKELARRRLEANEFAAAVEAAKEAVRRAPQSWDTHHTLGRAYMGDGKLTQAIASFRRAGRQPEAPSYPFNNLGYALLLANRPEEALEALDVAVERGPVTHFMMNNLGLAYEKLARYDDAQMAFLGALELKPDYVKAKVNLDRVGETQEQLAKAEEGEDDPALLLPPAPETAPGAEPEALHGG